MSEYSRPRRRALVVGIDSYLYAQNLRSCANDAEVVSYLLGKRHEESTDGQSADPYMVVSLVEYADLDGDSNVGEGAVDDEASEELSPDGAFDSIAFGPSSLASLDSLSGVESKCSTSNIYNEIDNLFRHPLEYAKERQNASLSSDTELIFFFSGHAVSNGYGLHLLTAESAGAGWAGISLDAILCRARQSEFGSLTIILDCCFSGAAGNVSDLDWTRSVSPLPENVFIIASSGATKSSSDGAWLSPFSEQLTTFLQSRKDYDSVVGSGFDSYIHPGIIFDAILKNWDDIPVFKSHLSRVPRL